MRGIPSRPRWIWKWNPQCSSPTKGGDVLSSFWQSSLFEVAANKVFCGLCGYIPHICRNGEWWTHRSAAQIPGFTIFIWRRNNTQSGGTGLNLTVASHAAMTQQFWVLNQQRQAFAPVGQLAQGSVPHTWLLNTGHGGYYNHPSNLHQHCRVAQMGVLDGHMRQPDIESTSI